MDPIQLRLPATSANLGPGFDALGLAMSLWLEIDAAEAPETTISATGRNVEQVESLDRNLILTTYRSLAPRGPGLSLQIRNGIPLGMGCGSSAAALLAGVMLANHFGGLGLSDLQVRDEACRREGHPDNVAACFHGGLTVSAMRDGKVTAASFGQKLDWKLVLALPSVSLSTEKARALLPDFYSRADVVQNIQATALMVSAFALAQPELLLEASRDRVHQPYRGQACPLLPLLLPLAGESGVYSVTLSGAGPSVLLLCQSDVDLATLLVKFRSMAGDASLEVVATTIGGGAFLGNVTKVSKS